MLEIRTLGGASVRRTDGTRLGGAAGQRRSLALLSVLAAHADSGIRRDRLLALLWPDGEPDRSRHALTQSLYHVRRALASDEIFISSASNVRLNPDCIRSDVSDFEARVARGDYRGALELYDGPFLEGFVLPGSLEFDQWVTVQRARLHGMAIQACERVAAQAEREGDWPSAVSAHNRAASLDPLNGRLIMALMRSMWNAGDRAGAIQQGTSYCDRLRAELEIEPDDGMTSLIARLRATRDTPASARLEMPLESVERPAPTESLRRDEEDGALIAASSPRARWAGRRILLAIAATIVIAVGVAWGFTRNTRALADDPNSGRLIVAPFRISGADPSLGYLRHGMVELLSRSMASDSVSRAVDPGVALRAWASARSVDAGDSPVTDALQIARNLGAQRVIVGGIVGNAGHMIVSASLVSATSGEEHARATVEGPADSVFVLVDRLASRLLASSAGEADRLTQRLTPSVAALRAFLEGQEAYRRGDHAEALRFYESAVERDSSFALAAFQLALMADRVNDAEQHDRALALAWANRADLSERDRLHLIAFAGPRYPAPSLESEQFAAWERAVAAAPDRADVWYELSERLFRVGAVIGLSDPHVRAKAALSRALTLDPTHQGARRLLIMLAARNRDTALLRRIASPRALRDSVGALSPFLRWRVGLAVGDSTQVRRVRASLSTLSDESLRAIAMASLNDAIGLDDGESAARIALGRGTLPGLTFDALMAQHTLALNEGRPQTALRLTEEIGQTQPGSHAHLRLRVLDALYSEGDRGAAATAADSLAAFSDRPLDTDSDTRAEQLADLCVVEQWRIESGVTGTAGRAIARLRDASLPRRIIPVSANQRACAAVLEASLAVSLRRQDAKRKVAELDSLMLSGPAVSDAATYANIVLGRLYQRLGDRRAALAAFRRRSYMTGWPRYLATIRREEAELAAGLGDTIIARNSFGRYLALRRRPEAALATSIDTVRGRVGELEAALDTALDRLSPRVPSSRRSIRHLP